MEIAFRGLGVQNGESPKCVWPVLGHGHDGHHQTSGDPG